MQLPEGTRIQDRLISITDGGLDFTFDCTGNVGLAFCSIDIIGLIVYIGKCNESST